MLRKVHSSLGRPVRRSFPFRKRRDHFVGPPFLGPFESRVSRNRVTIRKPDVPVHPSAPFRPEPSAGQPDRRTSDHDTPDSLIKDVSSKHTLRGLFISDVKLSHFGSANSVFVLLVVDRFWVISDRRGFRVMSFGDNDLYIIMHLLIGVLWTRI